MSISSLKHTERKLPSGGMVLVLDSGAVINPEAEAMIQALHSRSTGGIQEHLKTLQEKGAEKFMASFYVGYGHKSIGDCGSLTIFIEGVSMLAAKAIQDWRLYSGQESSTRYVDFSKQTFIDPLHTKDSQAILEDWRSFYLKGQEPVQEYLKKQFPKKENEKEIIYIKAIKARAFDIMRGFLPAGASTNLAWHSNLRQLSDKLMLLRHHPLEEVKDIAQALEEALCKTYPSSFECERFPKTENYNADWMTKHNYFTGVRYDEVTLLNDSINRELLKENRDVLENRPFKTELPKYLAECGTMQFGFMLDFGSFRDIQRHRAITQRMPLHTARYGFTEWYLNELPKEVREEAEELLKKQETAITKLNTHETVAQYYNAMGYSLPNRITGDLPALVYLLELRSTRFVHPTLQKRAIRMAEILKEKLGDYGLVLHLDDDPGRFDVRRGEQDVYLK